MLSLSFQYVDDRAPTTSNVGSRGSDPDASLLGRPASSLG